MKLKKIVLPVLIFTLFAVPLHSSAYVLNSKSLSHRLDANYWIDPNFDSMETSVEYGILAWNSLSDIQFTDRVPLPGADIQVEYAGYYSGDTYAVSKGNGRITVYNLWSDLSTYTKRKETIVHEVGHEAGLAHTQSWNDDTSVMRQYGFNNKPYPLADDMAGIRAKY